MIAKNDSYKVGDLISGEKLTNKTMSLIWEITECNRVDGGHVTIKDNNGRERTCMFVYGKGTQKPKPQNPAQVKPQERVTPAEEVSSSPVEEATPATPQPAPGDNVAQVANIFASLQSEAYNKGYQQAQEEASARIDNLAAQVEELKNQPKGTGTTINITINGKTNTTQTEAVLHPKFARVCKYLANGKNVYLYGPAGTGKNVLAEQVAKSLGLEFFYINTLYTKYDVTGFMDATGKYVPTVVYNFLKAENGLILIDEIDNSMAEALIPINALLANGYLTFSNGETLYLDENHKIIAAGNTNGQGATEEYNGRYKMDESTRSRFAFIFINYDAAVEKSIVGNSIDIIDFINDLRKVRNEINISIILGYREIKNLKDFEDDDDLAEIVDNFITKGMEQDTINEIASRLEGTTKWHTAFKKLAK
ncbi:AAA family ATPase [Ruminococcus sp.]|uniref:AAA family ATPase n=1 Tax=Ruminococcus sp. TaxID=41978 RepID=UPI003EFE26A1